MKTQIVSTNQHLTEYVLLHVCVCVHVLSYKLHISANASFCPSEALKKKNAHSPVLSIKDLKLMDFWFESPCLMGLWS